MPIKNNTRITPGTEKTVGYIERSMKTLLSMCIDRKKKHLMKNTIAWVFILFMAWLTLRFGDREIARNHDYNEVLPVLITFRFVACLMPPIIGTLIGRTWAHMDNLKSNLHRETSLHVPLTNDYLELIFDELSKMEPNKLTRAGYEAFMAYILLKYQDSDILCDSGLPQGNTLLSIGPADFTAVYKLPDREDFKILEFSMSEDREKTVSLKTG